MSETESEDEDLKQAIALSLSQSSPQTQLQSTILTDMTKDDIPGDQLNSPLHKVTRGMFGIDRKAMEQERLARLAAQKKSGKRERSITPPPLSRPSKVQKIALSGFQSGLPTPPSSAAPAGSHSSRRPLSSSSSQTSPVKYPEGVVKKTWAYGHPRSNFGLDIKIEEVIERQTLRIGIFSAFQWDTDWVFSKVDFPRTKLTFVMQAKTQEERSAILADTHGVRDSLDVCFPPMDGANCMHSKLMLLFHPEKLRVVVPSANLMPYDWGETGTMENSVFMIDLPRLQAEAQHTSQSGKATNLDTLPPFGQELVRFVTRQGMRDNVIDGLLKHDWSGTRDLAFIHTIGGASYTNLQTGYMSLNNAVRSLGLRTASTLQVDFAASSIGSLNEPYLCTLHAAARGAIAPPSPSAKESHTIPTTALDDKFRIYFPTHETVTSSKAGHAGTICTDRKWFNGAAFPRHLFRDHRSLRTGLLSHSKLLFSRGVAEESGDAAKTSAEFFGKMSGGAGSKTKTKTRDLSSEEGSGSANGDVAGIGGGEKKKCVAWAYVGSANMSESAWGKMVFDRARKELKMSCRNWECGVLVPVALPQATADMDGDGTGRESKSKGAVEDDGKTESGSKILGMDVFRGKVDVPFQVPGEGYAGRQPWYFKEHMR